MLKSTADVVEYTDGRGLRYWILLLFMLHSTTYGWRSLVGLVEKDVLCEIMMITVGFDLGFSLGLFLLVLYHIASENQKGRSSKKERQKQEIRAL